MSRRSGIGKLFVGRLSKRANNRDLEEVFEHYGRLAGCDIKYGAEMAYAFVDFEDRRDAEDAVRKANGTEVCGSSIVVEWAKGGPRASSDSSQPRFNKKAHDECYKCHRTGHWARDCPEDDYRGYRRRSPSPRGSRNRDTRRRSRSRSYERRDSRSDRRRSRSASKEDKKSASRSRSRSPRSRGSSKS